MLSPALKSSFCTSENLTHKSHVVQVFNSWHRQSLSWWKAMDSIYYSSPNFLVLSIKVFSTKVLSIKVSFLGCEKLACGLPWLQTLNYSSLLIPNKSIFSGKIPGSLFQMGSTSFALEHEDWQYWLLGSMLTEILFYLAENNTFYVRDLETNFNFLIKLLSLRYRLICTCKNNTEIPCITYSVIPVIADWKTVVQRHNQDTDADILAFKVQSIPSAAKSCVL